MRRPSPALLGVLVLVMVGSLTLEARSAPKPKTGRPGYNLDIHGFNDGDPYRLRGAEAEAVLNERGSVLFRFANKDWMNKKPRGSFVRAADVADRYPNRSPSDLVMVFRVDVDADGVPEMLLAPIAEAIGDGKRYGVTLLRVGRHGYTPMWSSQKLPGERHMVVDVRDLNGDGGAEILLAGVAGKTSYYQFHELVGAEGEQILSLPVRHVDSVHYVDLDSDGVTEVVVRERVGRRGPASQWTYVDRLYQWDGSGFKDALERFPRYHDQQTLPSLLGDIIDLYEVELPILEEKVDVITRVRAETLDKLERPRGHERKVVRALAALHKNQRSKALKKLLELDKAYPYHKDVLLGLAQIHAWQKRWELVLDESIRALTLDPRDRQSWWWLGVALVRLEERSSAVASFHNLVRLGGTREEGLAFLTARRSEPKLNESVARAVDQALEGLNR